MRATAAVVLAVVVVAGQSGCSTSTTPASAPPPGPASSTAGGTPTTMSASAPTTPSPAQAEALAADLSSGDAARVAAAIGGAADQPVDARLAAQLAQAGPLVFAATMTAESDGVVTTTATLGSGASQQTWDVRLVLIDGKWRLGTTMLRSKP